MKVLVIGGGGREHALVWKLVNSPSVSKVYCAPGNPGIANLAECVNILANNHVELADFVASNDIALTVVGPEIPLVNGIADYFMARGLPLFGPSKAAAQIEGSKAFCKNLMRKYDIPTAKYEVFTDPMEAKAYVEKHGVPIVLKADGLAAGKGVVVAFDKVEAFAAIEHIMQDKVFGQAGSRLVIEEFMVGEEASLLAFTDGFTVVPMVAAQDHKRVFDGDQGPNTGGMGAYAPAPVVNEAIKNQVVHDILQPVVDAMRAEGCLYKGCLYAGLMITADGPKVVEFNARFGDPETQVVLPLLKSDLALIMLSCINGTLSKEVIEWSSQAAVCVVLASEGYPGNYVDGLTIKGLPLDVGGVFVFHAGTKVSSGDIVTAGGRVLGVTALGGNIDGAVAKVYNALTHIEFNGMHYRKDIAARALKR